MDREYRKNCPVRAVTVYLERTRKTRKDMQFFVAFGDNRVGRAVCKQTLARWMSTVICDAYRIMGRVDPVKTNPHTTRGVATSWAEMARAGLAVICEAATWTRQLTFAKHYRLDFSKGNMAIPLLTLAHQQPTQGGQDNQ